MPKKLRWELVKKEDDNSDIVTWRAEVPGGWFVSVWAERPNADARGPAVEGGSNWGGGLTFYPDPQHRWDADVEVFTGKTSKG